MSIFSNKNRISSKEILFYKNLYLGKRCFILGNGPSLNIDDINLLRWEYTFVSNKFYYCFDKINYTPSFYAVEDFLVIKQHHKEIDSIIDIPCFIPLKFKKYFKQNQNKIFFNVDSVDKTKLLQNIDFPNFSYDCLNEINWGSSIVYTQIQLAVYMGFKNIFLLGMDHDYKINSKPEQQLIYNNENNHFLSGYLKVGELWNNPQLPVLEKSFDKARQCTENIGVNIINVSRKTKLQSFQRGVLEDILNVHS